MNINQESFSTAAASPCYIKEEFDTFDYILDQEFAKPQVSIPLYISELNDEISTMNSFNQAFEGLEKLSPKPSCLVSSKDSILEDFDVLYEKVESFLDREDLHIAPVSPVLVCKTLKPCVAFTELTELCFRTKSSTVSEPRPQKDIQGAAMPKFLARRANMPGVVNNVKTLLLNETKEGIKGSSIFFRGEGPKTC